MARLLYSKYVRHSKIISVGGYISYGGCTDTHSLTCLSQVLALSEFARSVTEAIWRIWTSSSVCI